MSELKPCPFCGETVSLDYSELPNKKHWYITCDCCGMMYQAVVCQRKDTKTGWNTRPIEDDLRKRIAELEAAQRWHVVADGDLPNTYKPVLTVDMSEATRIPVPAFYNLDTNCWSTHFEYDLWVTHWMPLPEPPEVK